MSEQICRLCNRASELKDSHVIPKTYFKRMKKGVGQVTLVPLDSSSPPKSDNYDPKEKLLCHSCEQYLSREFENKGAWVLRRYRFRNRRRQVEISSIDYPMFYLYLVSILWRASISSINDYADVSLGDQANEYVRSFIKSGKLVDENGQRLDRMISISISRLIDNRKILSDDTISSLHINFGMQKGATLSEGLAYYFVIDGFLILFYFRESKKWDRNITGLLVRKTPIRFPTVDIGEIDVIASIFNILFDKARAEAGKA